MTQLTPLAGDELVAAWPARKNSQDNPFQAELSNALSMLGVTVVEFDPLRSWREAPKTWHWHWPENQLAGRSKPGRASRAMLLLFNIATARVRRISLVLTIHNITPHRSGGWIGTKILALVRRSAAGLHFLSHSSREEFLRLNPWAARLPFAVTAHGRYTLDAPVAAGRASRAYFGLNDDLSTLTFVGQIDDYKDVHEVARTVASMNQTAQLLILGRISDSCTYADALRHTAQAHDNIVLVEGWAPENQIATALEAADIVVLPYRKVTNSGAAVLALGANRPVLVPRLGSLPEVAEAVGSEWIYFYDGALTVRTVTEALQATRTLSAAPDLTSFSWSEVARRVLDLYARVVVTDGRYPNG